ncbi:MAG: hypothetical protein ACJ76L_03850, partial [Conexibacter sp.]
MRSIRTAVCAGALALALTPTAALAGGDPVNGTLDQVQQATNSNSTTQSASSEATTKQVNVNAPVSVLSKGSNNGDVDQSNDATTVASSQNSNETYQSNDQNQQDSVQSGDSGCGCDRPNGDSGATQSQQASNDNSTDQSASSVVRRSSIVMVRLYRASRRPASGWVLAGLGSLARWRALPGWRALPRWRRLPRAGGPRLVDMAGT